MSGPNTPGGGSGSTGPGSGSEASETLGGFGAIKALVENEERIESLYKRRMSSFDDAGGIGRGPYRAGNSVPLIMTTESFAAQGRYIIFWAGPKNVAWRFPMRAAQQQTRSGTIHHTWRNGSRSSFFDEPEAVFTFQAGNIMPVRIQQRTETGGSRLHQLADPFLRVSGIDGVSRPAPEVVALPAGLFDFYEFFELLNEEKILPDGRPNFVFIAYSSLVYPEIFLRGFFSPDGISFTEDAQNPAELTWTSTFKVRSTSPPFYNSSQMMAAWRSANTNGASSVLSPATSTGDGAETPGKGG
ncbi:MAG: hypothetical protein DRI24_16335 [Deltaproteobacteria bacterium]|nr:MAG: hypothetical protein DRI24_16335 [Deltaproteobacteria bacterium]